MRFARKEDLEYKDGYIVLGDEVVSLLPSVMTQLNRLEVEVQHGIWKDSQPKAQPQEPFEFVSEHDASYYVEVETPTLDAKVDEANRLMQDIDRQGDADRMNDAIERYEALFDFAGKDECLLVGEVPTRLDLHVIGNPLTLTPSQLAELVRQSLDVGGSGIDDCSEE